MRRSHFTREVRMPERAQGRPCPHHDSFAGPASRLYGDCRVRDPMASITGMPAGRSVLPADRGDSPLRTAPNYPAACPAVFVRPDQPRFRADRDRRRPEDPEGVEARRIPRTRPEPIRAKSCLERRQRTTEIRPGTSALRGAEAVLRCHRRPLGENPPILERGTVATPVSTAECFRLVSGELQLRAAGPQHGGVAGIVSEEES